MLWCKVQQSGQERRRVLSGSSTVMVTALVVSLFFLYAGPVFGGDEGDNEIVKEFKDYFKKGRSVAERIEAILVLKDVNSLAATEALTIAFDDEDFKVREAAIATISTYSDAASARYLIDSYILNKREKKHSRLACAAEALGGMGINSAVAPLGELFKRARDWELKRAIGTALGRIKSPESLPVLTELFGDKDPTLRIVAIDGMAEINRPDLCKDQILDVMANDKNWQVRASAIDAVRRMRFKEGIQPLIERMREEKGRLRGDAYVALKEITFHNYDDDPETWQRFWDAARDTYEVPDYEKVMAAREKREKEGTRYSRPAAQFLGIPTKSKRIIFVIDISGSMETQVVEIERFRASGKDYDSFQRLEIVKSELVSTIENLGNGVEYNILAFATEIKWWKKKLVPTNILNKNSAAKFVRRLKPLGGARAGFRSRAGLASASLEQGKTNTYAALLAAFGVPDDEKKSQTYDKNLKSRVDTIYFLSDGCPTVGKVIDQHEIRAEVKRINKVRKIVLHTIAIGDFQKNFMKALAKDNGGVYVDLGK